MSFKVWKFPVREMECEVSMPEGARILSFTTQADEKTGKVAPVVYALVNDAPRRNELRRLRLIPTGVALSENIDAGSYHGTVQVGDYVFHLFEAKP